jgi:hypothetical protein
VRQHEPRERLEFLLEKIRQQKTIGLEEIKPGPCLECDFSRGERLRCPIWKIGVLEKVAKVKAKRDRISVEEAKRSLLG